DVAMANYQAGLAHGVSGAFNIASGTRVTINTLASMLTEVAGLPAMIEYGPPRPGDVRHSLADVSAARAAFGYSPTVQLEDGLREYMTWARGVMV
ncbi:MAG TPA: hypothetical protein VG106_03930, partial [Vicinamibacterales bacterium]|nr:hypothetical protein [Vicinamibacterales bacterium]